MLKVYTLMYEELSEEEKKGVPNNGGGKEHASYIKVMHNNNTVLLKSDAMEPEDAIFYRDLKWITTIIAQAYELCKHDFSAMIELED